MHDDTGAYRIDSAQNFRAQKNAAALLIQKACGRSDGASSINTKLVECPVVDSVPARARVLYIGAS
jgi:hypothetical protein